MFGSSCCLPACNEPLPGNAKPPSPQNDCWGCSLKNGKEIHPQGGKKLGMKLPFALTGHCMQFWWEDGSFLTEHKGCPSGPQREVTFSAGCLCPPNFQLPPSGQSSPCALITALVRRFFARPALPPQTSPLPSWQRLWPAAAWWLRSSLQGRRGVAWAVGVIFGSAAFEDASPLLANMPAHWHAAATQCWLCTLRARVASPGVNTCQVWPSRAC